MRRLYGQGSYTQQIVISDLKLGDRNETNSFGTGSEVAVHHFFTVDDLTTRVIVSLSEPEEDDVWQFDLAATGPTFIQQRALVPKGGERVSLGLRYDLKSSRITGLYDTDTFDEEPPIVLTLPIELNLSEESELRLYIATTGLEVSGVLNSWTLQPVSDIEGDFNGNGILDAGDIDQLSAQVRSNTNDSLYDLNADALVDDLDRQFWVHDLKQTYFGDAGLNGTFDSTDLVQVLASGEYEDDVELNSTWLTGDWDGDGEFTSGDLVVALADGGYEVDPAAVPEPAGVLLAMAAAAFVTQFVAQRSKTRRA
jgi:hypothetical protein